MMRTQKTGVALALATLTLAVTVVAATGVFAADAHTTTAFAGAKVNGGTVVHSTKDGKSMLTLSADFKSPDTPDSHWQVVDSKGNVYLLQRLMIKGDKMNTSIVLPTYVKDVAKVQIWCAWAEALLGEASFQKPVM